MKINFEGVESGFDALPSNKYHVVVSEADLREAGEDAKHPGSEYYNWTFTILSGKFEGRKLFTNTSLLENALFALKGLCEASQQWTAEELASDEFDFDPDRVVGTEMVLTVSQKPYQGEMQNQVKKFRPATDEFIATTGDVDDTILP